MYIFLYICMKTKIQMNLKQQLINYLKSAGKTDSWVNLYNVFPFKGEHLTNKQKSDTVRKLYKRKVQNKNVVETKSNPKILIFDLETAPLRSYVWKIWKENINPLNGQLQSESFMITWSAKWLFEDKIMSDALTKDEILNEDDSRLVKSIYDLVNEADLVIAHNAQNFDVPVLNTRFIRNGLRPTTPYRIIDTLKEAKKHFKFTSNKLDYLGKILGLGEKIPTDFNLWVNCLKGSDKAIEEMRTYNIQDVLLLEDVYLALRPYIKSHPNLNLYIENDVCRCPSCLSDKITWEGTYVTNANKYYAFRCNNCGAVGRSRSAVLKEKDKKMLTIPVPR